MKWNKKGLIYCPDGEHDWEVNTFMTPHAMLIDESTIRIFGGVRDKEGISRIKYIDVSAENPGKVLYISERICFDIGNNGCFDDNGMILGDILQVGSNLYMYYVGFQHVQKAKFCAFSGLAISDDKGENFKRYSEVPIMDRTSTGRYGRCIHSVLTGGKEYEISRNERREIMCLARDKYESFLWTYGKNPPADLTHGKRFGGGSITVKASLKNSRIEQIRFEGDFLGCMEMKDIEQLLNGVVYERDAVSRVFEELDIRPYFGTITKEEVVSCIMGDDRI